MNRMITKRIFDAAYNNMCCNTSYPLNPILWGKYSQNDYDIMENAEELSFYIHIPFCKSLCSFCEYTKFLGNDEKQQNNYIALLKKQIEEFINTHKVKKIYGLDVGGGTPTSISDSNFEELMTIINDLEERYEKIFDYEKSIEINFVTITDEKLSMISRAGFERISAGLQIMNERILSENNREYKGIKRLLEITDNIRANGIKKINIDLMYGLKNQSSRDIDNTIEAIKHINPEHVTLYEMRYNIVGGKTDNITRELVYNQYMRFYEALIDLGYIGILGGNTFSRYNDNGLSSYLKYRMLDCIPYKGFGISAQSMSMNGVSYNNGKNEKDYDRIISTNIIYEQYIYKLPKQEILAKYIAISLYGGAFKLCTMNAILNDNVLKLYEEEFEFLINNKYIYIEDGICRLTGKGFKYYGGIAALFYSSDHKKYLLENSK